MKAKNTEATPVSPAENTAPTPPASGSNSAALPDDRTTEFRKLIPLDTEENFAMLFASSRRRESARVKRQARRLAAKPRSKQK